MIACMALRIKAGGDRFLLLFCKQYAMEQLGLLYTGELQQPCARTVEAALQCKLDVPCIRHQLTVEAWHTAWLDNLSEQGCVCKLCRMLQPW